MDKKLRDCLIDGDFTLTDVIDEVIDINALIGVGIISLGDHLKEYCYDKIGKRKSHED